MGTKQDAESIQNEIKRLSKTLGWSQNKLAREVYIELHEYDDYEEIRRFQERFKKELQRKTTSVERLKKYFEILIAHPDARGIDCVFNRHVRQGELSTVFFTEMEKISRDLDGSISGGDDDD